jgi:Fic family protein
MKPPYKINSTILKLVSSISEKIGAANAIHINRPPTELRKRNRIKTIQASLAIEGNTLSEEQITALLNNERIIAPKKDILEVQNEIKVYKDIWKYKPTSTAHFLKAHYTLLQGLMDKPGKYRLQAVGIAKGSEVAHLAPPSETVTGLMTDLFTYLKTDELALIKSCVFHYELEFIHPFLDGNGRMGRLWQTLILIQEYPIFEFLPIETIIKQEQDAYYSALAKADKIGMSTPFIEFMLGVIEMSLVQLLKSQSPLLTKQDRIEIYKDIIQSNLFSRQEYLAHFKTISTATASRDLKFAVENDILNKEGDKRLARYWYV